MRSLAPRRKASLVLTLLVVLAIGVGLLSRTGLAVHAANVGNAPTPHGGASTFNPASFRTATRITNPYLPFLPGTEYIYKGSVSGKVFYETVFVTHHTKNILGVPTVVVVDTGFLHGQLEEKTDDYYAQDAYGNVWYFGEFETQYKNGKVVGHGSSWLAGVHGAQPGIVMEGISHVGDAYRQENAPGVAEDRAQVLSLTAFACAPYNCYFGTVLLTKEFSPLEPGIIEHKWYAPGVGTLKTDVIKGGMEQTQLVAIKQL